MAKTAKTAKPAKTAKIAKTAKPAKVAKAAKIEKPIDKVADKLRQKEIGIIHTNLLANARTRSILERAKRIGILLKANPVNSADAPTKLELKKATGFTAQLSGITNPTALIIEVNDKLELSGFKLTETLEDLLQTKQSIFS